MSGIKTIWGAEYEIPVWPNPWIWEPYYGAWGWLINNALGIKEKGEQIKFWKIMQMVKEGVSIIVDNLYPDFLKRK